MKYLLMAFAPLLSGCILGDDNSKPIYGKETGMPVNCRAYVQVVIDGYKSKQYSADASFAGLERNCGINGTAWKENR